MALSGSVRVVRLVDTATGESYEVRQPRRRTASFGRRFTVIFDDTTAKLATTLGGNAARLMLLLPSRLDFRSWKPLRQVEVGQVLGLKQSAVCKALAELKRHYVVESQGKGASITWRLCRHYGYRGTPEQFHADQRASQLGACPGDVPPAQPMLKLGPNRVINGGKHKAENRHLRAVGNTS